MRCLVCSSSDPDSPCCFHPGRRCFKHGLGARDDYQSVYEWTCCGRRAKTEAGADGHDVLPPYAPGCASPGSHLWSARILLAASEGQLEICRQTAKLLADDGFVVRVETIADARSTATEGHACVLAAPQHEDSAAALEWIDKVRSTIDAPWVLLANADTHSESVRTQTFRASDPHALREAVMGGVRAWHGRLPGSPYPIFLSYRRTDHAMASVINRFMPSWFDQDVLQPGVDWAAEIEVGIRSSQLFMMLLRGTVPGDAYVWRELDLAIRHSRPLAIIAFADEGIQALDRCHIPARSMQRSIIRHPGRDGTVPYELYRAGDESRPVLYFPDMQTQLGWPLESRDGSLFDTPRTTEFLSLIRDFPKYQFYSNQQHIPLLSLIHARTTTL